MPGLVLAHPQAYFRQWVHRNGHRKGSLHAIPNSLVRFLDDGFVVGHQPNFELGAIGEKLVEEKSCGDGILTGEGLDQRDIEARALIGFGR